MSESQPNLANATAHRRSWLWAVVVVALVGAVFVSVFAAHTLASQARHAGAVVAAPSLPPLSVAAVAHPEAGALLVTYDPASGHLATLASQREPFCPPVGACQTARTDAFMLLDGATGQPLARNALTGDAADAADATLLLDDPVRQWAYAIAPQAITIFSTASGALVGHYSLNPRASWSGAALDPTMGRLFLVGGGHVMALDAPTGATLASAALPASDSATVAPDGPVFDPARGLLYIALRPISAGEAPRLLLLNAATLQTAATLPLPPGARLGPLDPLTGTLDIFGGDARGWRLHIGPATSPALIQAPALDGALAVGANTMMRHLYVAGFTETLLRDAGDGRALAALPLAARWPPTEPLPTDSARGLLYLPTDHGAIAIVQDGVGVSTATAAILARAALARLLPDTNQDPPFVAPETFPLGAGAPTRPEMRPVEYWIHFADRGWEGGHPGTASVAVAPDSGQSGGYLVTFTITWQQLFQRTHTWVCAVAPNGAVALRSETGDTVP